MVGILAGVNWLSSIVFFRWDLTEDKRYTISEATKQLLGNLDKDIIVNVYLAGDFPPGFERLENATRETLEEFKAYSNGHLSFQFSDPSDASSEDERKKQYQNLVDRGLTPTNLFANEDGKRTEKLIFPGAIVQADTLAVPVQLLKGNKTSSPEDQLNQSYEGVEFQLASAVRILANPERKKIGLLVNHTQKLPPARLSDLIATMQQNYDLFMVVKDPETFEGLDALMILKPDVPFTEDEKFQLDQYVLGGGKALFFVDGAKVDSVSLEGNYVQPLDLNLGDLFFKWGVRINNDLIKDLNSATIPMNVGNMGDKPEIKAMPWRFFPLLNNFGKSPVTSNLDAVYARFVSSLDTVGGAPGLKKTALIMTSPYTRLVTTPALVGYNEARQQPDPKEYNGGVKLTGVLLEGSLQSLFENRILPSDPRAKNFRSSGQGKILICADGDIVVNDYDYRRNTPYPLGYDRVSGNIFGNKDFVMNALDYMTDANGIINARSKTISIRPLDKIAIQKDKKFWQALNILLPLVLIAIFGLIRYYIRRSKFA